MATETTADPTAVPEQVPERRWWQRLPFLVLLGGAPPPFGLYFVGFIAIALLLSDRTRESEVRAGGAVLVLWWVYSFREGDTSPYVGVVLLAIAAVLFALGARRRIANGDGFAAASWPMAGALLAAVLGVVVLVPYGYRQPELTREAAAQRVFAERAGRPWKIGTATDYLVEPGRVRVIHKPFWYVVVYERHATITRTVDNQPCFARREVWGVDALSGSVSRSRYDDAAVGGDPCLPIRLGTERDLKPAPR